MRHVKLRYFCVLSFTTKTFVMFFSVVLKLFIVLKNNFQSSINILNLSYSENYISN